MPTYEYACRDCGQHLEVVQSFTDQPLATCPACQGRLRKVFSAAGIVFKGSGWHIKDYGTSKSAASSSDGASKKDGDSKKDGASKKSGGDGDASSTTEKLSA